MKAGEYATITGRRFNLRDLEAGERQFLGGVLKKYQTRPEWTAFGAWWVIEFGEASLSVDSVCYRICQDLEARLGIAQGKVAPPDYRDYLADLIEERFGSRYRFCKETGIDPGHLSRVLAKRAELSFQSLEKIMVTLDAALVIQPQETLSRHLSPEDASEALAAATAA